jgi:gamma-glutamyl hercynylcysteine S-oxide synthase
MLATQSVVIVENDLSQRIADARRQTDELFAIVKPDALYDRPIAERHRIVFYIGHLEAFDWNLLHERVLGLKSSNPEFDRLFAFGIDPVGGGLPNDQPSDWPSMEVVREYVRTTRAVIDEGLRNLSYSDSAENQISVLLNVAVEHRLMHAETLAYMLHQLPLDRKIRHSEPLLEINRLLDPCSIEIPAGNATLGLRRDENAFGWDNEYEGHTVHVPAFAIDKYMVTNGQYLKFVNAEGYEISALWAEDDWNWKSQQKISHPAFWKRDRDKDQWLYRTMFDEISLPPDWPVYVSHAEAKAYAKWAGKSLPTEAEWQRAAYATPSGEEQVYPWGNGSPSAEHGNFDFARWSPASVAGYPAGRSAFGVEGMLGNGWEWTSTEFAPFAGFEPFSFYRGYSADFFDGKHFVMKGGSARTAKCMLRSSFRNWFQSHYQFMYAGFRCVSR